MTVVTGGSRGIGRAIVLAALAEGSAVLAVARGEKGLDQLKKDTTGTPGILYTLMADIGNADGCEAVKDFVFALAGDNRLTLVNNAGMYTTKSLTGEPDVFELLLAVNLLAAHRLTRLLWSQLEQVINIGSVAATDFSPQMSAYAASKAAFHGWHEAIKPACLENNIRLGLVIPGATLTSSWENEAYIPPNILLPQQIADIVIRMVHSDEATVTVEIRPTN